MTSRLSQLPSDIQGIILEYLSPTDCDNIFSSHQQIKDRFDTEHFWIRKARDWTQQKLISAKKQCLFKWNKIDAYNKRIIQAYRQIFDTIKESKTTPSIIKLERIINEYIHLQKDFRLKNNSIKIDSLKEISFYEYPHNCHHIFRYKSANEIIVELNYQHYDEIITVFYDYKTDKIDYKSNHGSNLDNMFYSGLFHKIFKKLNT